VGPELAALISSVRLVGRQLCVWRAGYVRLRRYPQQPTLYRPRSLAPSLVSVSENRPRTSFITATAPRRLRFFAPPSLESAAPVKYSATSRAVRLASDRPCPCQRHLCRPFSSRNGRPVLIAQAGVVCGPRMDVRSRLVVFSANSTTWTFSARKDIGLHSVPTLSGPPAT